MRVSHERRAFVAGLRRRREMKTDCLNFEAVERGELLARRTHGELELLRVALGHAQPRDQRLVFALELRATHVGEPALHGRVVF